MIKKYSLIKLSIIFTLLLLFPLVQKQWLNLYLFDIQNFSIYKFLYYISGLICPVLVIIVSLNNFTFYKFNKQNLINHNNYISGKKLLFLTSSILITISILISSFTFINIRIFFNLFISNTKSIVLFDIYKQILFVAAFSILLLFNKVKVLIKKISLVNFFIMSIIIWYLEINNIVLNDEFLIDILKFENINFLNILFILFIDIFYYLWSYISYGTNLSDWNLPIPNKKEVLSIFNIKIFYFFIFIYYSILFN